MANHDELVHAICLVIQAGSTPIPITLMNHSVEEAAAIIGAVVERRAQLEVPLTTISMDPELGKTLVSRTALS